MIAHYLQCGHKLDDLLNLSSIEKCFYMAAMEIEQERRAKMLGK